MCELGENGWLALTVTHCLKSGNRSPRDACAIPASRRKAKRAFEGHCNRMVGVLGGGFYTMGFLVFLANGMILGLCWDGRRGKMR